MGINAEPIPMDMSSVGQDFSISSENLKTVSDRNYRSLKRYYGEAFVKSNDDTADEYGFSARSLGEFADFPDFADKLKAMIPNRYNALKTLRDNFDYINATLKKNYEKEGKVEKVIKNPYELARRVGYELTGPFEAVEDLDVYRKDFRDRELICTYKEPEARLRVFNILWLRHKNADNILPADELTAGNLSEEWKQYLREINRYDAASDTYNLVGIRPTREDPYGTSSMSVQIIKEGTFTSIKNRYNHTVGNPDSTLLNNLDGLVYGLKDSVYAQVGREDLIELPNVNIAEGYVRDNKGGLHASNYEKDGVNYGNFEQIKNGEVIDSLSEKEYFMLSPELYVSKDGAKVVNLNYYKQIEETEREVDGQTLVTRCYGEGNQLLMTYILKMDETTKEVLGLKLRIAEGVWVREIHDNPSLTTLEIAEGGRVVSVYNNSALTSIDVGREGEVSEGVHNNPALTTLGINEGSWVKEVHDNPTLTVLNVGREAEVSEGVYNNPALTNLGIAERAKVKSISYNSALITLEIAEGAEVRNISDNNPGLQVKNRNLEKEGETNV